MNTDLSRRALLGSLLLAGTSVLTPNRVQANEDIKPAKVILADDIIKGVDPDLRHTEGSLAYGNRQVELFEKLTALAKPYQEAVKRAQSLTARIKKELPLVCREINPELPKDKQLSGKGENDDLAAQFHLYGVQRDNATSLHLLHAIVKEEEKKILATGKVFIEEIRKP